MPFTRNCSADAARLAERVSEAECVVVGAGAGLSTAAGFTYDAACLCNQYTDANPEKKL